KPMSGSQELAYVTDNELGSGGSYPVSTDWRGQLVKFLSGVQILIHDTMYSDQIIDARRGWGHSTPRQAVDLAAEAGARTLFLFHHEPEHGDDAMDVMVGDARDYARTAAPDLTVEGAAEGASFSL